MIEYDNFRKSLRHLEQQNNRLKTLSNDDYPTWIIEAVKESVIKRFQICWNCLWEVLRCHLVEETNLSEVPDGPNPFIQMADRSDLLPFSVEQWVQYGEVRVSIARGPNEENMMIALEIMSDFVKDAVGLYQTLR